MKYGKIQIRFCPYTGKYGSEKSRIWANFTQCCSGVSFANFEQVVAVTDVILTICGCWLLQNLEKRNKSNNFNRLHIEVFYLPNISPQPLPLTTKPPKIGPLNAFFALTYTQEKLTRFWRYLDSFLKEHKTKNMFFISLQKLFSFSRKSNFRIPDIQISWRHQIPKHKTRNAFSWIIWELNTGPASSFQAIFSIFFFFFW